METIGQVIGNRQMVPVESRGLQPTCQLSPALQQKTMLVRQKYGNREQFLERMNPSSQNFAAQYPVKAFFNETAPTVTVLRHTYGANMPAMWMLPQIFDLCEFTGVRKMDEHQAINLANVIANEYGYLKVSELLLFFYRMKTGRYGVFFGAVDPMRIMEALKQFMNERSLEYEKRENELKEREREESAKNAITPREYCRNHGYPEMDNVLDIIEYERKLENVKPPKD